MALWDGVVSSAPPAATPAATPVVPQTPMLPGLGGNSAAPTTTVPSFSWDPVVAKPLDLSTQKADMVPQAAGGFVAKQSTLGTMPFTDTAKNIITKETNLSTNADLPAGIGGSTTLKPGITNVDVAPNQPPATQTHELFHTLFMRSGIDPAQFNAAWEAAKKNTPSIDDLDKQINDPKLAAAYHGNGENTTNDPYALATERFALLGSLWGNDGLSSLPADLQKYYAPYLSEPAQSEVSNKPAFSFNPVLTPAAKQTPPKSAPSKITGAVNDFYTPPKTPAVSTIPASLYDQAKQATNQHFADTFAAPPKFTNSDSTPETSSENNNAIEMAKNIGQGLARIPAEFAITAGQAGFSMYDLVHGTNYTGKTDTGVPTTGMEALFGDQPLKGYGSQILDASEAIKNSPFAQSLGLDKHALPLAFAGVVGGQTLNFAGGGGEDAAISALAKTTDVAETTNILRTIGVQEDLLSDVAPKIAAMKDPTAIKDALNMVDNLQKTTKLTDKIAAGPEAAAVERPVPKPEVTVGEGTQIPKDVSGAPKSAEVAAGRYWDEVIAPKIQKDEPLVLAGDDMKEHFGGDYAPEKSDMYAKANYQNVERAIKEHPGDFTMLGGGPGSGKTELLTKNILGKGYKGILYDTTLSNYEGSKKLIEAARAQGKNIHIFGNIPDLQKARDFTFARETETGRPVSDDAFARGHAGFIDTAKKLLQNGVIKPNEIDLYDMRNVTSADEAKAIIRNNISAQKPLDLLNKVGYSKEDILNKYGKQTKGNIARRTFEANAEPGSGGGLRGSPSEDRANSGPGVAEENAGGKTSVGQGGSKKQIVDKVPLPPSIGDVLSSRRESPEQFRAIQTQSQEAEALHPQGETPRPSDRISSPQATTAKVDMSIAGENTGEKVRNAIGRSEALGTHIVNKGQEAYIAGRGLLPEDLNTIRDEYQAGTPIEQIAAKTSNPAKATAFMQKLENYYDYQLAADRAAGGDTPRVQNYLPQYWDLEKPQDLEHFNELAKQKGLQQYYGFKNQPKVFKSYAEGIAAGFTPAHANILEDLKYHYNSAAHVISRQALKQGLHEAAGDLVSMSGTGLTDEGHPYVNSNIPGLEGISYHPQVARLLKGYEPLRTPDFIQLVKDKGAKAALEQTGVAGMIDKTVAMGKSFPASAKEAGMTGVMASIYDHMSDPMKQVLWNWSGFHSVNITLSHMGASILHPITGAKGVLQSVGSAVSERLYRATVDSYKNLMVAKDAEGNPQSVFDWAVESGAFEKRDLPAHGVEHFNPFSGGKRMIFDREIPVLQLNLAEQTAKKGIVATSPEGIAVGKEIRTITGEINSKTMNIDPNTIKMASRAFLAPGFTYSKYKTLLDSVTAWGKENGAAGNLARQAVIGKSAIVGTAATLGTLLASGKFPNLQQLLTNYTVNPSTQTNMTNPKGQKLDITYPKTFLAEGASAVLDPIAYGNARLNPLIADMLKLYTNKDYYGRPLVDPNVNTSRALQLAQNLGIGHLPIGSQAVVNTLLKKQTAAQGAIQVAGLNTRVAATDPMSVKYAGLDAAKAQIQALAPDDPNRLEKMQAIFNNVPAADRKSLAYQEMISGVSTKGVYQSAVEQKYFEVQDLLAKGDTEGAAAITKAMTPQDYQTYKSIKTRLAHVATYQKVKDLVKSGDMEGAKALTGAMTKQEYSAYLTWKKNNP